MFLLPDTITFATIGRVVVVIRDVFFATGDGDNPSMLPGGNSFGGEFVCASRHGPTQLVDQSVGILGDPWGSLGAPVEGQLGFLGSR